MKEIYELEKRLIDMTERYHKMMDDWHGKSGEPSITIAIDNNLKWIAEIYSYVFNFEDGGRHHVFEANSYKELVRKLKKAVDKVEKTELVEE